MRHPRVAALTAVLTMSVTLIALSLLGGGPAGAATTKPPKGAGGITFGSPAVVDPVHTFGEPDIRIAPDGTTYVSGPWGTGTQRSLWERSVDGGTTYRPLHDQPIGSSFQSASQTTGPGGGDTELSIDHTGKVYYADLAALTTLKVATWNNTSRTMQTGVIANQDQGLNGYDRQWFGLWDPSRRPRGVLGSARRVQGAWNLASASAGSVTPRAEVL